MGKLFTTAAAVLAFSTAGFAEDTPTRDTIVASVNGTDITLGHVLSLASRLPEQYQSIEDDKLFDGIVDQLVQQQLLSDLITEETTVLRLAGENERRALYATEAIESVYSSAVTEDAVKAQYEELYVKAEAIPEYHASHILVETEEEAKAIIAQLESDADFVELAKEKSTGPSGPNGGDLGWAGLGQFVPEFEAAMVSLEAGKVSEPVKTQFGWHVIKLNETRNQPVPELETVRGEIEDGLRSAALTNKISELETSGSIDRTETEIDPAVIRNTDLLND
ncbi:peptidylprolyl isomerase [Amylibacter sp. SFDW26]|nr:peptidylprolyl isomerase [Amylibacter sp. SFDW26]